MLIFARIIMLVSILLVLNHVVEFELPLSVYIIGLTIGSYAATLINYSSRKVLFVGGIAFLAAEILSACVAMITSSANPFLGLNIAEPLWWFLISLVAAAVTGYFFIRSISYQSLELVVLISSAVYLLSGHRHYKLDSPDIVTRIAFALSIEPATMFIALGGALAVFAAIYFMMAPGAKRTVRFSRQTSYLLVGLAMLFIVTTSIGILVSKGLGGFDISKGRTSNGVGEASEEGTSPLGFHSALGTSSQPAALVRLEGDYSSNPLSPKLYLRESALSAFNGKEMVIAANRFDTDVPRIKAGAQFVGKEHPELMERMPLNHSIYLLSDHRDGFAIDYPISIQPLVNPDPGKFRLAYRAYSMVPAFFLPAIADLNVGDPAWSELDASHYISPHPDYRYLERAQEIVGAETRPVVKAFLMADFLSKKAIYTLSPNHIVPKDHDPVAPFLFGDMRGYCVHFSHAIVYMLRALRIPARIATGYMTDLSQARDGHVLLRMSDRHSWAELFVEGRGWIPVDPQPEQVESHADTPVDMNLLDELMNKLTPGEELLPKDEITLAEESEGVLNFPIKRITVMVLLLLLSFSAAVKIFDRYSWMLPASPATQLRRAYNAVYARLLDFGSVRMRGETLNEFAAREGLKLPFLLNQQLFANHQITRSQLKAGINGDIAELQRFSLIRRISALFSLRSLFNRRRP